MKLSVRELDEIYNSFDFSALERKVKEMGRPLLIKQGSIIQPGHGDIIIIANGVLIACNDVEDPQLIGLIPKFYPVGMIERDYPSISLYYKAKTELEAFQLSWEEYDQLFRSSEEISTLLHKILVNTIAHLIQLYYERNAGNGYITIRTMLYRYNERSKDMHLINEGIVSYIVSRTLLSRSYVFRILSDLKSGGYITVVNGKLKSIDKEIPIKY